MQGWPGQFLGKFQSSKWDPLSTHRTVTRTWNARLGEAQSPSGGSPRNMKNIEAVQVPSAPFTIICDSIRSNWPNHDLWVPERGELYSIEPDGVGRPSSGPSAGTKVSPVSLEELAHWRHAVIEILTQLEATQPTANAADGIAVRISRLSHRGAIPREIAAYSGPS